MCIMPLSCLKMNFLKDTLFTPLTSLLCAKIKVVFFNHKQKIQEA